MLELLNELPFANSAILVVQIIQIDILVPGRHHKPRRIWDRGEFDGRDCVCGWIGYGELICCAEEQVLVLSRKLTLAGFKGLLDAILNEKP